MTDEPSTRSLEVLVDVAEGLGMEPEEIEGPLEQAGVFELTEEPTERVEITTTPVTEPSPPSDLPAYLTDPVDRQSPDELRALAEYALKRAAWADRDLDTDELDVDDAEELVDVKSDGKEGYVVEKKIPCGKDCSGCPHGPYRYRQWRDGDTVRSEYLGKADA
jgi:hypothetical protein